MTDTDNDTQAELAAWELLAEARRERDEWKAKYIQQNKDLRCEQMDPNGTIWDYAKELQAERDEARKWSSTLADAGDEIRAQLREERQLHIQTLNERDEARGQLAGIENKMRGELGGHPDSELWGDAGLIAATMRCVDALGEVTDQRDEALGLVDRQAALLKRTCEALAEWKAATAEQRDEAFLKTLNLWKP